MNPAIAKILIANIIWGSVGLFVKNINLPSMEIVFLRAFIASIFLSIFYLIKNKKNTVKTESASKENCKKDYLFLIITGIAMGINWILLFQAYKYTTIANSTMSYYCAPVFLILLSPIVLKEKFTVSKLIAVIISLTGLFLILTSQPINLNANYNHTKGILYGLTAAVFYASVILLNKYIKNIDSFKRTLIQVSTAAIFLLPFVIARNNIHLLDIKSMFFILIVGIIHTGIAFLLYFSAMAEIEAQTLAVLSYVDPFSALMFASIFLGENLSLFQALGGILILSATLLGNKQKKTES